ncbi:MAG: hypothetical protein Q8773_02435, partial [Candidatus Phytoplasma australasiaticum]|nr:hypothetical protein [Candidatus Phytoplasma australasiaticum]
MRNKTKITIKLNIKILFYNTDRLIAFYSAIYLCCFIYNQPPSKPDKQVSQHPAFHNSLSC